MTISEDKLKLYNQLINIYKDNMKPVGIYNKRIESSIYETGKKLDLKFIDNIAKEDHEGGGNEEKVIVCIL